MYLRKTRRLIQAMARKLFDGRPILPITQTSAEWDAQYEAATWDFLLHTQPNTLFLAEELCARTTLTERPLTICDIGCGNGALIQALKTRKCPIARYVGLDISESAISKARELYPQGEYRCVDLSMGLPEGVGNFDAYVLNEVLYYLPSPRSFLEQVAQVCTNNTFVYISMYDSWRARVLLLLLLLSPFSITKRRVISSESGVRWFVFQLRLKT